MTVTAEPPCEVLLSSARQVVETSASVSTDLASDRRSDGWRSIVDELARWGSSPQRFDADNPKPADRLIDGAIELAMQLADCGVPVFERVHADGDGGIVFERRRQDKKSVLHIWEDGKVEWFTFRNGKIEQRFAVTQIE